MLMLATQHTKLSSIQTDLHTVRRFLVMRVETSFCATAFSLLDACSYGYESVNLRGHRTSVKSPQDFDGLNGTQYIGCYWRGSDIPILPLP